MTHSSMWRASLCASLPTRYFVNVHCPIRAHWLILGNSSSKRILFCYWLRATWMVDYWAH
jgi:hypothetical protein